jgi:hypothetical protein
MPTEGSPWWRRWSIAAPVLTLVLAVAGQAVPVLRRAPPARAPHLARSIPSDPTGWISHDEPLGADDFLAGEVKTILNYDDMVNRVYVRGDDTFGVYAAYWQPGKMPTRMVASHTPDRCWTENGWHCVAMKFHQPESVSGQPLMPAEWRQFMPPGGGAPIYVLYWMVVDGRLYDYGRRFNQIPDPWLWWKDAMQQAVRGEREQYFVRVTSNRPIESLRDDPGFVAVMRSLGALVLARPGDPTRA